MPPIEHIADKLEKPAVDDREYRVIRLPNQLEALLVHDPETDKASASLNVNVGNFSDDTLFGLAHAVEHALFMGTEKYPKENAYNQYLAAHSGDSNAYTAATETNYFFEVAATSDSNTDGAVSNGSSTPGEVVDGLSKDTNGVTNGSAGSSSNDLVPPLYGALDRFAQFFIAPLFDPSTLDRELRAVDSENKKNLQSDTWRLMQLAKSLSNTDHPYHHFSTGNLQTLRDDPQKQGINVRNEFMKFHEKHYSANRMKLVVLGRETLDQQEQWVGELFADVKNKDLPPNRWDDVQPLSEEHLSTQIFAKPVMDMRSLDIYFPYQDEREMSDTQPSRYLSHLIGHEGPGSILSYIKAKGWANSLSAGVLPVCPGAAFFTVSVRLTEDGLKEYHEVVKVIFEYISLIKEQPPQQWIFDEMKNLAEVEFKYKQKSPASRFTSRLSSVMQKPLPRDWLLSGATLIRKFDPAAITQALGYLRADNFRIMLVSQHYPGDWDSKEKWYGTEYKVEKIPEDFSSGIRQALETTSENRLPDIHLPHKNEFVPTRLSVEKKEVAEPLKEPSLIRHDDNVRIWFKKDDRFWVPKGSINVTMRNPLVYATPANFVKAKLYCHLVKDALMEYSYDAEIAGLDYNLSADSFGLDIQVDGYNDKMPVLLEKVLVSMRDLEVKPDRFNIIKEQLARAYRNAEYQQPFYQVSESTRNLTIERSWINDQYAAELEHIEAEDIAAFFPQIIGQAHVEVLVHGNLYKEDALTMTDLIESTLKCRPLPQSQWFVRRNLIFPPGSNYVYERPLKDPANVNHCIEYYLFVGLLSDAVLRAKLLLFSQMTSEPAFDQLRSQEQLGYVVWSGSRSASTTMGYRVIIQSERTGKYLESRIDAFLSRFAETLENMTEEDFEGHKRSLVNKRLEKLKNLGSETNRFLSHIGSEIFNFTQNEQDAACVRALTKPEMIEFFRQYIDPNSAARAKLSIHMIAQSTEASTDEALAPEQQKAKLTDALAAYLSSAGVAVETEKFQSVFDNVDVSSGDKDAIISAVKNFLVSEMKLAEEKVEETIEQGAQKIDFQLSQLGIKALPSEEGAASSETVNGSNGVVHKEPTYITNVPEFKAKLPVSSGSIPIKDLSEFEDIEPKL
ncbi:Insulinase (Peptidase M16) [Arachnomyces sp. PD_36]|nr:Insulinase (Peptidase M16) [Arachnomyces sp. PD_36]